MRKINYISLLILSVLMLAKNISAVDVPHSTTDGVKCNSCHTLHAAPGSSLTNDASNANLCISCHTALGAASSKPLAGVMQANVGARTGNSHRWDAAMPAVSNPGNAYGLRAAADLSDATLRLKLTQFSNAITCSVCHNQHSQTLEPWDPSAPATGYGRHFMRITNDLNNLCEDCHYYRTPASGQTDVRTWDGNKKSHPVVKIFTNDAGRDVTDTTQFNNAPLEPSAASWAAQTGARYHLSGGTDGNPTNNMVVDSGKRIRCLSCHGMHYTDSNSTTVDQP